MISFRYLVSLCFLFFVTLARAATLPEGFQENVKLSGHTNPIAIRFSPNNNDPSKAFIAEKSGRIYYYDNFDNQSTRGQAQLVADLSDNVHDYWDRGLLGLAIHPNFPATPELYALYAFDPDNSFNDDCADPTDSGCVVNGRLSRLTLNMSSLSTATTMETVLIQDEWCQQYPSHSIGDLHFGSDGFLYLSSGDGASFTFQDFGQNGNPCNDPFTGLSATSEGGQLRSQDILTSGDSTELSGSILRLDISGSGVSAPADNPLAGGGSGDDFIIAIGLRNPFRFNFRPGTNELWIADVGWNTWEEINRLQNPVGDVENFGWPCFEGPDREFTSNSICSDVHSQNFGSLPMTLSAPFYTYSHSENVVVGDGCGTGGSSVTGISFNNKFTYPVEYNDAMFFADSTRQCIWVMFAAGNGIPNPSQRATFVGNATGRPVDIQLAPNGNLHYVDFDGGRVFEIESFGNANQPPQAKITADVTNGAAPLAVQFSAAGTIDEELGSLAYAWDLNSDGQFDDGFGVNEQFTYTTGGSRLVQVRVVDVEGLQDTASILITVGNSAPLVSITNPMSDQRWIAGEVLNLDGNAVDAEEGILLSEALSWSVILEHCASQIDCHDHPVVVFTGESGSFVAPNHEYPAFLRLELTATDSGIDWYDSAWPFRHRLNLDNSSGQSSLADFPILINLTSSRIDYSFTQTGGRDLVFTDLLGNVAPHEIESWNENGESTIWVKVSNLAADSASSGLYMYYGNPNATDSQDSPAVWSNGYAAVWHMNDLSDSTASGSTLVNNGTDSVVGEIGNARSFNGVSHFLSAGTGLNNLLIGDFTFEVFADTTNTIDYPRLLSNKNDWQDAEGVNLELSEVNRLTLLAASEALATGPVDLTSGFHYLAGTYTASSGEAAVYSDGVIAGVENIGLTVLGFEPLNIGRRAGDGDYFAGSIDEVRISNITRNADWIAAQQLSLSDELVTYGPQESNSSLSSTASVTLAPETMELTISSVPAGLALKIGGQALTSPNTSTHIVNSTTTIEAVSPQVFGATEYTFVSWSNGNSQSHNYIATANAETLTATFQSVGNVIDSDGDLLPDVWELMFGLDPINSTDATLDGDNDRLSNLQEFANNTNPNLADSDADGWDDFTEITFGGDPNDSNVLPDPPIITIDSPLNGATIASSNFTALASWTGNPVLNDHLHFTLDTPPHTSVPPDASGVATLDYTNIPDGSHTLTVHVHNVSHMPYLHSGAVAQISFTVDTDAPASFKEQGGQVVMEAENFISELAQGTHMWLAKTDILASNAMILHALPDTGANNNTGYLSASPGLNFPILFSTTGIYHVWVRGVGATDGSDSIHIGLNGSAVSSADRLSGFSPFYGWSKATMDGADATLTIGSAELQTVNVWMREDGFVFDKILLTTDTDFTPQGFGPAESPRIDDSTICGNGIIERPETCDDGNNIDGDNCSAQCKIESNGVIIPARIEAEDYVRFFDTTAEDLGSGCDTGDAVDKQLTTDSAGGVCNVGWTAAGEWLEYDIEVQTATIMSITARVASALTGRTFHIELDGIDISGAIDVPSNGWQAWQNATVSGIPVSSGSHIIRIVFDTSATNLNFIDISVDSETSACNDGLNLITNCDFNQGLTGYPSAIFFTPAAGSHVVENGAWHIAIDDPGDNAWEIQPRQEDLFLVAAQTYSAHFDVRADAERNIEFSITKNQTPWTSYSGTVTCPVSTEWTTCSVPDVIMPIDDEVKFEIKAGGVAAGASVDVYVDKLYLAPQDFFPG